MGSINRILVAWILGCVCIFLSVNAFAMDCSDLDDNDGCYEHPECCVEGEFDNLKHVYYCDALVNGDCSREGLYYIVEELGILAYPNNDPEFDCDDTSCGCYWQACSLKD